MRVLIVTVLLASFGLPAALRAQSLAAVAQREAERRKQTVGGKKYTNEELLPAPAPAAVDAAQPAATASADAATPSPDSASSDSAAAAGGTTAPAPPKAPPLSEAEWRAMARERRERIQRFRGDITALEGRLAQVEQKAEASPEARSERQALAEPLANLRGELAKWEAEFSRFEQRARAAKIPPEWIQ
jgi:hypothetical protein